MEPNGEKNIKANTRIDIEVDESKLDTIESPEILDILTTIKKIQKRMKDPDVRDLEYIRVYDKLSYEFDSFFNRYTGIFIRVIKGENLRMLASVLYYRDQVLRGLVSEEQLSDCLATRYLPEHLKKEADVRIKEMKDKGEI